jgi:flagellar biosynthesis/type III secretory pathway chaperone
MDHLAGEETNLVGVLDTLRRSRAALLHGDLAGFTALLEEQLTVAPRTELLRQGRERLRQETAAAFDIDARGLTLQQLADFFPTESRERLAGYRDRLRRLGEEADQLNRGNAAIVRHCLDFMQRVVVDLTGGQVSGTYGPAGKQPAAACGSFLQVHG